jgi:hypothetical protein
VPPYLRYISLTFTPPWLFVHFPQINKVRLKQHSIFYCEKLLQFFILSWIDLHMFLLHEGIFVLRVLLFSFCQKQLITKKVECLCDINWKCIAIPPEIKQRTFKLGMNFLRNFVRTACHTVQCISQYLKLTMGVQSNCVLRPPMGSAKNGHCSKVGQRSVVLQK